MHVGVGSANPVKRRATAAAIERVGLDERTERVAAVRVGSGVAEQPRGHAETVRGAETRARRVREAGFDLGVGIEGGVASYPGAPGTFLVMWAAVTDGDRTGRGAGPSLALPPRIADRVDDGAELGPVMDDVLGEDDVAKKQGAAGAFTAGGMDRGDALATAVVGALAPFVSDLY